MIQLDFFQDLSDLDIIRDELKAVKESNDKVRKGMFARHNELAKMMMDINERLAIIESNICKGESGKAFLGISCEREIQKETQKTNRH